MDNFSLMVGETLVMLLLVAGASYVGKTAVWPAVEEELSPVVEAVELASARSDSGCARSGVVADSGSDDAAL